MASTTYRFSPDYVETLELHGATLRLALLRPEDKASLQAGFERTSMASRYRRFLSYKGGLSPRDLAFLTETDGVHHFALGAAQVLDDGSRLGIAVARFVRLEDDPGAAEPAFTVVDDWQGKGLGRILFDRLVEAARERGIVRFECTVLSSNTPMLRIFKHVPETVFHWHGDVANVTVPLT